MKNNRSNIAGSLLGKTDIHVTPIGLGTWQFAGGYRGISGWYWPEITQQMANQIIKSALDNGINWFDTAECYGNGRSERLLASSLKSCGVKNGDVTIVTKWWPLMRTADSIRRTIDDRLRALDGFSIDLYLVHQPWSLSPVKSQMNAMAALVEQGKVRSVGVSNFGAVLMSGAYKALKALGLPLAVNQVKYNLFDRTIESNRVLETAKEYGVTIIAWSPLDQGMLTGRYHDDPSLMKSLSWSRRKMYGFSDNKLETTRPVIMALKRIADKHNATVSQVALSWITNFHKGTVVTVVGASKASHIEDNAKALHLNLSSDEIKEIDELSRPFKQLNPFSKQER
ncbi:MAG: aldo/keto reductase [Candidatus Omnitrophica bacterium]|nr:aldo/keto reductase [Candidatus Omnitrophota bacterium]